MQPHPKTSCHSVKLGHFCPWRHCRTISQRRKDSVAPPPKPGIITLCLQWWVLTPWSAIRVKLWPRHLPEPLGCAVKLVPVLSELLISLKRGCLWVRTLPQSRLLFIYCLHTNRKAGHLKAVHCGTESLRETALFQQVTFKNKITKNITGSQPGSGVRCLGGTGPVNTQQIPPFPNSFSFVRLQITFILDFV